MTAHVSDDIIDNGLASLKAAASQIFICSAEPTNFTEASSSYALGVKDFGAGNVFPDDIAAGTNGRKVTTAAVPDGSVTGDGTVTHVAIVDTSAMLAVTSLSSSQAVVTGNTFSLAAGM